MHNAYTFFQSLFFSAKISSGHPKHYYGREMYSMDCLKTYYKESFVCDIVKDCPLGGSMNGEDVYLVGTIILFYSNVLDGVITSDLWPL